jgi:hypothetical protein
MEVGALESFRCKIRRAFFFSFWGLFIETNEKKGNHTAARATATWHLETKKKKKREQSFSR